MLSVFKDFFVSCVMLAGRYADPGHLGLTKAVLEWLPSWLVTGIVLYDKLASLHVLFFSLFLPGSIKLNKSDWMIDNEVSFF